MKPIEGTSPFARRAPDLPSDAAPSSSRPGRRSRRVLAVARFTLREILRRRIFSEAGAIAFFLLLAIPPGMSAFAGKRKPNWTE